ncbi:MAG: four helix bundle protein [Sedimentisphaerales bacterium]|nr:four helix bundle protein [Sedimentisphaerales bacterium]
MRFLNIAQVSLEECRYYLILVSDLGCAGIERLDSQLTEASKLLRGIPKP